MNTDTIDATIGAPEPTISAPEPIDTTTEPAPTERPRSFQWGTRRDGTPRAKPGRPRKGDAKVPRAPRTTKPGNATGAAKPAAPRASAARKRTDYKEPIGQLLAFVLTPLSMFVPLDAMAIGMRAEEIVTVGDDLANDVPIIGAYLDKYVKVGPYAKVLSLVVSLGAQIAHNHGKVPEQAVLMLGGVPRTKLIEMRQQQQAAAAAQAAEERARFEAAMAGMAA